VTDLQIDSQAGGWTDNNHANSSTVTKVRSANKMNISEQRKEAEQK